MSKTLQVQLPEDIFAKLEQIAQVSGLSSDQVAGNILRISIEKLSSQEPVTETINFESALNDALHKNEELLRRLAR